MLFSFFKFILLTQVLYISYDGLTDPLGQSQILPYVKGLAKMGYSFTIISCEKPEKYDLLRNKIQALCDEDAIEWVPLTYHKTPPVLSTLRDHKNIWKTAVRLHHKKRFALVHCRGYISALTGRRMKEKYGTGFLFDMRGFFADERVDGHVWNLKNPLYNIIYRYFKTKERQFFTQASGIISLTKTGKGIIEDMYTGKKEGLIEVIPCATDMEFFNRDRLSNEKLEEFKQKIDSPLVMGYYGSLGTWYMLPEMLDQFVYILKMYPQAKFLLVTNDEWTPACNALLEERNIPQDRILQTSSTRDDMPYYVASTHIALFFIMACFSKKASSPTKHGEIMGMGVPLITNSGVGDMDEIVHSTHSGFILSDFNELGYQEAAHHIEHLLQLNPAAIRSSAMPYYSLEKGVEKYAGMYARIVSGK